MFFECDLWRWSAQRFLNDFIFCRLKGREIKASLTLLFVCLVSLRTQKTSFLASSIVLNASVYLCQGHLILEDYLSVQHHWWSVSVFFRRVLVRQVTPCNHKKWSCTVYWSPSYWWSTSMPIRQTSPAATSPAGVELLIHGKRPKLFRISYQNSQRKC